jgi:CDP-diacylglycerol--glycerol-3-phosphate 3-phosphatidyltransferase
LVPGIFFLAGHGKSTGWLLAAAIVYVLVAATDVLDGWWARRTNQETDLGKILDPTVDKVLVLLTLAALCMSNKWLIIYSLIVLAREVRVSWIRRLSFKYYGVIVAAKRSGKNKALAQNIANVMLLLAPSSLWLAQLKWVAVLVSTILTLWSWFVYRRSYGRMTKAR